jgi:ribosomal protein S18 acetylase RimI-like enzyme
MRKESWTIRRLAAAEWHLLRDIRLSALAESPRAFLSDLHQEARWGRDEWQCTFEAASWLIAGLGWWSNDIVGLLRSVRDPAHPMSRHVESIWVAPTQRKRGALRALLDELALREHRLGVRDLLLWVLEDNLGAQTAYARLGFEPTGERQRLPDGRFERRLRLTIADRARV